MSLEVLSFPNTSTIYKNIIKLVKYHISNLLKLSIITITYNAEAFLERTLQSVVRAIEFCSVRPEIEYLIIDGKSKDKTLEIAAKYSSIITKIVSEPDKGLYDAMNKGQKIATGDYVWFLNAGDEIHEPQTLYNLFEALKQNADVYYSDALFVNNDDSVVGLRSKITPHSLPQNLKWQDMKYGMKVCHQAFIAKRNIAPKYDIHNLSADIDWEIVCLQKAQKVVFLDFVLCKYLTGGLSTQKHRKSLTDRFKVLSKHFGFIPTIFNHVVILLRVVSFKS